MKRLLNIISKKAFISSLLFIIEIVTLTIFLLILEKTFTTFWLIVYFTNIFSTFIIVNSKLNNAFKISWIVLIILLPVVGTILFFIFGKKQMKKMKQNPTKMNLNFDEIKHINFYDKLKNLNVEPNILKIMQWTYNVTNQPTYGDTKTQFLNSGETYFKNLIYDLKNAKQTIFLEFFIICPGFMWNEIVNILINKAKDGLDVRLIYDDFGTLATLPKNYDKYLTQLKIKTKIFNKIKLKINSFMNNRDHRKIVIIDNKISYTGGINLADEYINKFKRFGYWQDSAIKLTGSATQSFTQLFLKMWNGFKTNFDIELSKTALPKNIVTEHGLVMPFGDNPINKIRLSNTIYLNIVNNAKNYVYIQTPYLIMDEQLTNAIIYAAQSCVKIIIVTPHLFDKFYVHTITQESYKNLIKAGVLIFEYTPGFLHSKMIISDDIVAVLGTANFDYRSLYMQFESSVLMYKTESIKEMVEHFNQILNKSKKISLEDCKNTKLTQKSLNMFLKPFITFL